MTCLVQHWTDFCGRLTLQGLQTGNPAAAESVRSAQETCKCLCKWRPLSVQTVTDGIVYELLRRLFHIGNFCLWVPFFKQLLLKNYAVDFVKIWNVFTRKARIKAILASLFWNTVYNINMNMMNETDRQTGSDRCSSADNSVMVQSWLYITITIYTSLCQAVLSIWAVVSGGDLYWRFGGTSDFWARKGEFWCILGATFAVELNGIWLGYWVACTLTGEFWGNVKHGAPLSEYWGDMSPSFPRNCRPWLLYYNVVH